MLLVSRTLLDRLKLSATPAYKLARRAGCHPSTLSKLLHGAERLKDNDPRIVAVGRQLGLRPEDCFSVADDELEVA
jgi:hypothetical protein